MSGASSADSSGGGEKKSFAESAARKFTELWQAALAGEGARPSLSRFLTRVPESQQLQLLEQLLPIELAARAQLGKPLDPSTLHGKLSPALLQRLEKLLAAPLELPTLAPRSPGPAGSHSRSGSASQQIGPYKLLQKLGEGGMGEVWMAEQERPVRRRVALKLIRAGLDNQQIIARFEAERQALSMMNHPNIAKVLDVGTTGDGLPYFVMELVAGTPFNKFCDEHKLSIRNRLKLFLPVCAAVQHAHQKGIIHRDLKPSNVLVCLEDGKPVPKVIDFGLAKALAHTTKLTDRTLFTEFGQVVGTLQYMSPEQAEMNQLDVDTRTDIYSLGVMLYELLTGSTPIDQATLRSQAILAVLATIREREPPRPSARLSSVSQEAASGISAQRQIEPKRLKSLLEGELDWIVMKALEKERSRRYETANGFADDIGNYLRGEVVAARPPSTAYRLAKYIRRHRGLVAALTSIATLLVAGIIATSWLALTANRAKRLANDKTLQVSIEKDRSTKEAEKAVRAQAEMAEALKEKEAALARSNYLLANARWKEHRAKDSRELLLSIPEDFRNVEWNFSFNKCEGSDVTLYGHFGEINCIDFSPDGSLIASGSSDNTINIWDATTGKILKSLKGHKDEIQSLEFSPDSTRLVSGSLDKTLRVWDATTGNELLCLDGHSDIILGVCYDPAGKTIASGGFDKMIKIWDAANGKEIKTLTCQSLIRCVQFSPDGTLLTAGDNDGNLLIWETKIDKHPRIIKFEGGSILGVSISPDSSKFAAAFGDGNLVLGDLGSGKLMSLLRGHIHSVEDVEFSADGLKIVSASSDGNIKVWDSSTGNELTTLTGHKAPTLCVSFSPDCSRIASGSADKSMKLFDSTGGNELETLGRLGAPGGNELETLGRLGAPVGCLAFHPDNKRIFSGDWKNRLMSWNLEDESVVRTFAGHRDIVSGITFIDDGKLMVSASYDKTLKVWDVDSGQELKTLAGHEGGVRCVASTLDGQIIASGGEDCSIRIWDLANGTVQKILKGHKNQVFCLSFSPDNSLLASGGDGGELKIWDVKSGKELMALLGHTRRVLSVAFSPQGDRLATGDFDQTIRIWDVASGKSVQSCLGHRGWVNSVKFLADGRRLVSASFDRSIKLWDASNGQELVTVGEHDHEVTCLSVSADGKRISSAGLDFKIKVWEEFAEVKPKILRGKTGRVDTVSFDPSGNRVVSGDIGNLVTIWDVAGERELLVLRGHSFPLSSVRFSRDGLRVVSRDNSDLELLWDSQTGERIENERIPESEAPLLSSPDGRWLLLSQGNDILVADLQIQNSPRDQVRRRRSARIKVEWHKEQATEAEAKSNWYAATFHRAWALKGKPDSTADRSGLAADYAKLREQAADQAERLRPLLPADMVN